MKGWVARVKKIPCEVYSRVVGYFRPVKNWNIGKQQEFDDRKVYDAKKSLRKHIAREIVNEDVIKENPAK
jgi:ribonucleoside-triphosphate reductase (formate)